MKYDNISERSSIGIERDTDIATDSNAAGSLATKHQYDEAQRNTRSNVGRGGTNDYSEGVLDQHLIRIRQR